MTSDRDYEDPARRKRPRKRRAPYERYRELNPVHKENVGTIMQALIDKGDTCMTLDDFRERMYEAGGQPRVSSHLRKSHTRLLLLELGASVNHEIVDLLRLSGFPDWITPNPLDEVVDMVKLARETGLAGTYSPAEFEALIQEHKGSNCPALYIDRDSLRFFLKQAGARQLGRYRIEI